MLYTVEDKVFNSLSGEVEQGSENDKEKFYFNKAFHIKITKGEINE